MPLLVSVVIAPEFDTPAPPAAEGAASPPFPPLIVPLLDSVAIVPEFDTPAPPALPKVELPAPPPFPPLIAPLLVSVVIVLALDTPPADRGVIAVRRAAARSHRG